MPVPDSSSSTSPSLIDRARLLDAEAWRRLCEVYGPLVYRWARAKGLQATDAADIGQEVFRTAAIRIAEFHRDQPGDTFRGWLRTITRYKLADYFRRRAKGLEAAGGTTAHGQLYELPADEMDEHVEDADARREILHRALALIRVEFEDKTWQSFWQTTVDGHPVDLVAAELGISRAAVRQAKYRILRRLRDEMRDERVT